MADVASYASVVAGVQAMEDQHGILVESINAIGQQLTLGYSSARLSDQIARLVEFTGLHFGCEESLLRRLGYPGLDEHCKAHQDLMNQIKMAAHRAETGEDAELERILESLRGQYLEHLERLDSQYTQWLNSGSVH